LWDLITGEPVGEPIPYLPGYSNVALSKDGHRLMTVSADGARVWDTATGKPLTPPLKGKTPVSRAVLSDDGRRLVTVGRAEGPYRSAKSEVQVWDVATAKAVSRPLHSDPDHLIVLLSPDGSRLFLGQKTWDKTRRLTPGLSPKEWQQGQLWDVDAGKPLAEMTARDESSALLFSRDGRRLAVPGDDGVRLLDPATGQPLGHLLRL